MEILNYIPHYYDGLNDLGKLELDEECGREFLTLYTDDAFNILEESSQLEIEEELKSVISEPTFLSIYTNDILQEKSEQETRAAPSTTWAPPTCPQAGWVLPRLHLSSPQFRNSPDNAFLSQFLIWKTMMIGTCHYRRGIKGRNCCQSRK